VFFLFKVPSVVVLVILVIQKNKTIAKTLYTISGSLIYETIVRRTVLCKEGEVISDLETRRTCSAGEKITRSQRIYYSDKKGRLMRSEYIQTFRSLRKQNLPAERMTIF
jgi:hypothetical protein